MSNLASRILVSLILLPIVIYLVYLGGLPYQIMVTLAGGIMFLEWQGMIVKLRDWRPWGVVGFIYIALPCAALVQIRGLEEVGFSMIIWLLLVVWGTDIGGYFVGKKFGGPKLCPRISPNKTWSGAFGGILLAMVLSSLFLYLTEGPAIMVHAFLAAFFSVIGQVGDLFESWIKRKCGVKDSGRILGGHGGMLDRLDGLLFMAPVAWVFLFIIRDMQ